MFKELQITLYDVFGYLLPGSVVTLAVVVAFWAILWPVSPLTVPLSIPALAVAYLVLASYLAGHLAQALSNILEKFSSASMKYKKTIPLSAGLEKSLRHIVAMHYGTDAGRITAEEMYLLCDQALVHNGSMGEREIFIYREGFYRGNAVALAVLSLAFFVRVLHSPATIVVGQKVFELHRNQVAFAAALTAFGGWLAYRRYLRFRKHKFVTCFMRFLSLWAPSPSKEMHKDVPT